MKKNTTKTKYIYSECKIKKNNTMLQVIKMNFNCNQRYEIMFV